jgi:hypothetical protein
LRYKLRVDLRGIAPPIWRTLEVPGDITLHRLHGVLQVVMGWMDVHLYLFEIGEKLYGELSTEWDMPVADATTTTLEEIAARMSAFTYEYDLGDGWVHNIIAEESQLGVGEDRPRCTGGARACPPEDCGGLPGYEDFLEAIADPDHEEHEAMLEWIGGQFDPEAFDTAEVNLILDLHSPGDAGSP